MKKSTFLITLIFVLIFFTNSYSQKVAIIGMNHNSSSPNVDGFSFVAMENIPIGEVVYFTDNEYSDAANAFTFNGAPSGEGVLKFTVTAALSAGDIVFLKETGTSTNTFTITGSGGTGTAVLSTSFGNQGFSLATSGDELYAYSDTDENTTNGITTIYSVLSTIAGNLPADANPINDYPTAIVVQGFTSPTPNRTEYSPALRNVDVGTVDFTITGNWSNGLANADLSIVPFVALADPDVSVAVSPASVLEDGGTNMVYTFTLSETATSNVTVNFSVGGTAVFSTDYTQTGATTFGASSGTIVIPTGTSSSTVTINPTSDSDLETHETVLLTVASGTGYIIGSPINAMATITNDDTNDTYPMVAFTGFNHLTPDGFSFVATTDIPANTKIYFTDNSFDNTTLTFATGEVVLSWTSPSSDVPAGQVFVITGDPNLPGWYYLTRSGSSADVGTIMHESGNLATGSSGETFYAYNDDDNNPANGVTDIYAVLYTGNGILPGGTIPAIEDPSGMYLNALVVDGFAGIAPNRIEYDPTKRNVKVDVVDFADINNWLHAQANQTLSTVKFDNLSVIDLIPPVAVCQDITVYLDGTGSVTADAADVDGGSTDETSITSFSLDTSTFDCGDIGANNVKLYVFDAAGNKDSCTAVITVTDTISPTAVCQNINVYLDETGNASIVASDIDGGSTDNCGTVTLSASKTDFTCADLGANNITLIATDGNGNTSNCVAVVTVTDPIAPHVNCYSIDVKLARNGEYTLTSEDISDLTNGTSDNTSACDEIDFTIVPNVFSCDDIGEVDVRVIATDKTGNTMECVTVINVSNNYPVQLLPVKDIEVLLPYGVCETNITYPGIYTLGPCVSIKQIKGLGPDGVFPVGTTTEVWEAINTSGKRRIMSFNVTVIPEAKTPTMDGIADLITDEDMPVDVSLSGISNGGGCDMSSVSVQVGFNSMYVSSIQINRVEGDSTGILSIVPVENMSGMSQVVVRLEDGEGMQAVDTFMLTINPINDAPYLILQLPDGTVNASKTFTVPVDALMGVVFDDIDDDMLAFDVMLENTDTLPGWANIVDGALTAVPMLADTGTYSFVVTATDAAGAMASDTFMLKVDGYITAIEDLDKAVFELNMYPNPTKGMVTIEPNAAVSDEVEISVMNITGSEVFRKTYRGGDSYRFDLSEHVSGMYMVIIEVNDQRVVKKLILDRK